MRHVNAKDLLHYANPNSDLYCNGNFVANEENERFDKDFAIHDKHMREQQRLKNDLQIEQKRLSKDKKRIQVLEREAGKWQVMNQAQE